MVSPIPRRTALVSLIVLLGMVACSKKEGAAGAAASASAGAVKIAAAADLGVAFKEVGAAFEKETGRKATLTFGSSGNFAKQIAEGAPFDLFASANASFVDDVVKAGACDGATKTAYGRGRIVIWTKKGGVVPPASLKDLADARFTKIAIANPEHAPYGKAAKQALTAVGAWDTVKPKLVYGENVQQTLQFAQTGNVEAAIVALSLALGSNEGTQVVIDDAGHEPLEQTLVVCNRGGEAAGARDFAAFVGSPDGRAIMRRFGFALPGEAVVKAP